jgi:hypothetical protein
LGYYKEKNAISQPGQNNIINQSFGCLKMSYCLFLTLLKASASSIQANQKTSSKGQAKSLPQILHSIYTQPNNLLTNKGNFACFTC